MRPGSSSISPAASSNETTIASTFSSSPCGAPSAASNALFKLSPRSWGWTGEGSYPLPRSLHPGGLFDAADVEAVVGGEFVWLVHHPVGDGTAGIFFDFAGYVFQ